MAYAITITNPHLVVIENATGENLRWLNEQRPKAIFNYRVVEHRPDNTLLVEFHFEDKEDAALFRTFNG